MSESVAIFLVPESVAVFLVPESVAVRGEKDFEFITVACLCWPSCLFASSGKSCLLLSPGT
ncbi:hypothetical protein Ahy_A02g009721 isoform A [Arachis hypogaea]|uniref:Uncharacterized protein n=1 Tax=Arachis hypogaea TaxID=3818 RepID=A0A445EHX3_ARAHY|nr:hypothetical protein Ahy_A02g009721 isoform A [Arachis hypogaea]